VEAAVSLFREGGVTLLLIAGMSVLALAIGLERATGMRTFRRQLFEMADRIVQALEAGNHAKAQAIASGTPEHPAMVVFDALLGEKPTTPGQLRRLQQRVIRKLRAGIWLLGTVAATAPFVGLFGTVVGIMRAFHEIGVTGGGGFEVVSGGISEALVTTAGGIAVGVEAMFLFNYLQARGAELVAELKETVEQIGETLEATRGAERSS